ncbi:MAG TPA: hypothetical protein VNO21_09595, partial [Polyangiaceae bacterium]|nr:hypothetical protein [Polyangiaceae bacterium]
PDVRGALTLVPPPAESSLPAHSEAAPAPSGSSIASEANLTKAVNSNHHRHHSHHHAAPTKTPPQPAAAPTPNDTCHCAGDLACATRCAT